MVKKIQKGKSDKPKRIIIESHWYEKDMTRIFEVASGHKELERTFYPHYIDGYYVLMDWQSGKGISRKRRGCPPRSVAPRVIGVEEEDHIESVNKRLYEFAFGYASVLSEKYKLKMEDKSKI